MPRALNLQEIQQATADDEEMQQLKTCISNGHHARVKSTTNLSKYAKVFPELSIAHEVIVRGDRILIPKKLQSRVLDICHESHLGIVRSKQLLRSKVWFPGIDKQMERKIANCIPCQAVDTKFRRNPLQMSELPEHPWQNIAVDFCGPFPSGDMLLVTIDERSRYPCREVVRSTSASETVRALEKIFAEHGVPVIMKSDNGPPFRSVEFARFCEEKGIKHQKVTPRWPEANGLVERFMRCIGKVARIASSEGKDFIREIYRFLADYRVTPHPSTGVSPVVALTGRMVRIKLPSIADMYHHTEEEGIKVRHQEAHRKQKCYADIRRHTAEHEIQKGDLVLIRQDRRNKLDMPYNPAPFCVENVKGTMVTARKGNQSVTRNSSAFKKLMLDKPQPVVEDSEEDLGCCEEEVAGEKGADVETNKQQETLDELVTETNAVPTCTRSGIEVRRPAHLQDYVT